MSSIHQERAEAARNYEAAVVAYVNLRATNAPEDMVSVARDIVEAAAKRYIALL